MQQFLSLAGRRVAVINLDPANDGVLPYTPAVDIAELISLDAVQQELGLGPNGGLIYCIDYLEQNLDWLAERLAPLEAGTFLITLFPGRAAQCRGYIYLNKVPSCAAYWRQVAEGACPEGGNVVSGASQGLQKMKTACARFTSYNFPTLQRAATCCLTCPARWSCSACTVH
jgi:hypothetical protein